MFLFSTFLGNSRKAIELYSFLVNKSMVKDKLKDGCRCVFLEFLFLSCQDAKKGVLFIDFPPVLQLHLKRFEYDFIRDTMVKVSVQFHTRFWYLTEWMELMN